MSAEARFRSFIDRILRLREEQDAIGEDVKNVYAEAKVEGYDKTAMGALVNELRKRDKNVGKFEEASAILELYRETYLRSASHVHAGARTREQTSSGMASETMDPSADHVSPPARNRDEGSGSANIGGGHEVSGSDTHLDQNGLVEGQTSLAAREGEQAAASISNAVAKACDDASRVGWDTRAEAKAEAPDDAEPVSRGEAERGQEPVADSALAPGGELPSREGASAEVQAATLSRADGGVNIVTRHTNINFPAPLFQAAADGQPSIPSGSDGGAKSESASTAIVGQAAVEAGHFSAQEPQAVTNLRCQKPETCKWARSQASCSPCNSAWMREHTARAA